MLEAARTAASSALKKRKEASPDKDENDDGMATTTSNNQPVPRRSRFGAKLPPSRPSITSPSLPSMTRASSPLMDASLEQKRMLAQAISQQVLASSSNASALHLLQGQGGLLGASSGLLGLPTRQAQMQNMARHMLNTHQQQLQQQQVLSAYQLALPATAHLSSLLSTMNTVSNPAAAPEMPPGVTPDVLHKFCRLYVGNLPPTTIGEVLKSFLCQAMALSNPCHQPGDACLSVSLNPIKRFAFCDMRSITETTAALQMDGITYSDYILQIRRPSDFPEQFKSVIPASTQNIPTLQVTFVLLLFSTVYYRRFAVY